MKILHTADIHLREYQDERWQALEELIKIGNGDEVNILVICGDLFDKDVDAERLRPQIREIFSDAAFKILIIPGNHDIDSYKTGMYFGDNVSVLGTVPYECDSVRIIGIPFEAIHGEELLRKIRAVSHRLTSDKTSILLCHGELLDAFFSRTDFGREGEGRYMPFKLSYFERLEVEYVLAGHFHSKFDVWRLENGGYFVYPGSPVSITRAETGQRKANLFEVGGPPSQVALDTFHFHEVSIELNPFKDENPVQLVQKHISKLHPKATAILTVSGYVNGERLKMTEADIVAQIKEIVKGKCADEHYEFKDISRILENDLFKSFTNEAVESGRTEEDIKQLRNITISAMMQAGL